jgi:hypothetical protein
MIAFAARRQVRLLDLATCRTRVLAGGDATDVHFSATGRWLAYSRRRGNLGTVSSASAGLFVVSVDGGRVRSPLGRGVVAWSWAPGGDLLYGLTRQGTLVSAAPTGRRRVITGHLGGGRLAAFPAVGISRDGRQAVVDRSRCGTSPVGELVRVDLATGARRVVFRRAGAPVVFAGFSPAGGWLLFWRDEMCSASLAADGMALEAVRATGGPPVRAVGHMLLYRDFMTWCGRRLIAAAGSSRETQLGSRLAMTAPPAWRPHTIDPAHTRSWVSPSCAPSGRRLAAAAGPDNAPVAFGHQHRSIWLLGAGGTPIHRLTRPPAGDLSDESPRFSTDGRWVLFVRSRVVPVERSGISKDTIEMVPADGTGSAVSLAAFTSSDASYYDHFDWPDQIAWHQPSPQTIRVARVSGLDLSRAYARLHAAGLRVSYPHRFTDGSFECEPTIGTQRVNGHLSLPTGGQPQDNRPLHQPLGQLCQQPARTGDLPLGLRSSQQLVDHLIRNPLAIASPGHLPQSRAINGVIDCIVAQLRASLGSPRGRRRLAQGLAAGSLPIQNTSINKDLLLD